MIQVSRRSWNGSIKYCRIHDLLRELAIEKAKENSFLQIISNQDDQSCSSTGTIRRATLHYDREDIVKYTGPNLRSLLYFGDHPPNIAGFRYLKVLLDTNSDNSVEWNISKEMTQLRYLGNTRHLGDSSRNRINSYFEIEPKVSKSIGRMRNLQTLDFRNYELDASQGDCIWNIKTVRHVILPLFNVLEGPPSTADLRNLQTLKYVKVRAEWLVKGWPKMPSIRVLRLVGFSRKYTESFRIFLNELHHLTALGIQTDLYEVLDMSAFPSYNYMQSLRVIGKWDWKYWNQSMSSNALDIRLFPIHLIKLTLWHSQIKEDPMPVLEKLKSLKKLKLYNRAYDGKHLNCSAGGFPRLEYLLFSALQYLEDWKVQIGGMSLLKEIYIGSCHKLVTIPELQHMTSLKNLTLDKVHPDLHKRLEGEESYKIQHIPFIKIEQFSHCGLNLI